MRPVTTTVSVAAVPRQWLVEFVQAVHEQVPAAGLHRPDYSIVPQQWSARGECTGALEVHDKDGRMTASFALESASDPRSLRLEGTAPEGEEWKADVDLVRWRCRFRLHHRWAAVKVDAAVDNPRASRWDVHVTAKVRPHSWARLAMLVFRGTVRRAVAEGAKDMASAWDDAAAELLPRPPGDAAAAILSP